MLLAQLGSWPALLRKHRYFTHRSRWALEMAARARSECRGARNGCSSPLGAAVALEMAARARLGAAGVLEACLGREGPSQFSFEMAARRMPSCMDMHGSALVYI